MWSSDTITFDEQTDSLLRSEFKNNQKNFKKVPALLWTKNELLKYCDKKLEPNEQFPKICLWIRIQLFFVCSTKSEEKTFFLLTFSHLLAILLNLSLSPNIPKHSSNTNYHNLKTCSTIFLWLEIPICNIVADAFQQDETTNSYQSMSSRPVNLAINKNFFIRIL